MSPTPELETSAGPAAFAYSADAANIIQEEDNERLLPPALLQYWHTMLRWRTVLLGVIGASLVVGLIATMLMSPLYTAKSEIEISRQQKKVTNVEGVDSATSGQDLEFYATQYTLLKSVSLAERVAATQKLASRKEFFEAHGAQAPQDPAARNRLVVALLLKNVSVDPVRTSRLVDVSYTSRSPAISAEITNAWTREFMGASMDREYASTADARQFLESRLGALRAKLEQSERDAENFASVNNIINLESSVGTDGKTETKKTLTASDLETLNQALLVARADRIAVESRAKSGHADVSIDSLNNTTVATLREKRAEVGADYAKLSTDFGPNYPASLALKRQLDDLGASIARSNGQIASGRNLAYIEALSRERDLQSQVDVLKRQLDKQNRATIQYNIYQRDADTDRQLYDALLQRYKEIGVAGTVGTNNIAIVDMAEVPTTPSAPKLWVNLALALLIGIGLSAVAVLALDQIDEGIRSPADVWNLLNLPLLGNVPLSKQNILDELEDAKSSLSEAYFSIRSNLAFTTAHGLPRSIAVTSAQAAEGKSTTALALAEIIGRTGKSVVLIDGDLRSPSVHALTGKDKSYGLSNLLTGDDNILEMIQGTSWKGLSAITSGPLPPSPAELLSTERLGFIIAKLLLTFDHVVIDAPPVLGLADAPLICRAVEGCVFVAEPGRSPLRGIRTALNRLRFVGARIFGVVVTKIDLDRQHYGYSYGYGYGYGRYGRYGRYGDGYGYSYGNDGADDE